MCQKLVFTGGSLVKNPANARDSGGVGSIPGSGRSSGRENGNPLQDSCLGNPIDRGAWRATVHGVTESWVWLSTHAHGRNQEKIKTEKKIGGGVEETVDKTFGVLTLVNNILLIFQWLH